MSDLDRYLDGLLDPDEAARVERELARDPRLAREVAAQRRLDDALRRRFQPPAAPALRPAALPALRRYRRIAAAAALALAAAAAAWAAARRAPAPPEPKEPRVAAAEPEPAAERAAPGLPEAEREPRDGASPAAPAAAPPSARPDLDSLYARMARAGGVPAADAGGLEARLSARYDSCLDVESASCRLFGPLAAPEWPSATVLIGVCETGDPRPALLVVDDQTLLGCAYEPDAGALSRFYKEVDGLAVWEVSADDHPRLLDAVRSCRE